MDQFDISDLMLRPTATLLEALRTIDRCGKEIAFVCDAERRLLGTLTDGDVRRALLAGGSLGESTVEAAMHRRFTAAPSAAGRAEVLDMMRARGIGQVPIVDDEGRLLGVHTLHELIGAVERANWAVVMAGGKGTRLRPLTESLPKPMIKVAGRPILERIVDHLVGFGIRRVFLSVNYLGHIVEQHFGDGSSFGCSIEYLRETKPLGTGGSLSLLPEHPRHPVLVLNGDLVTQVDVGRMLAFHAEGGFAATLGVRRYAVHVPYGVAEVCRSTVVNLTEKPTLEMLVNAGAYVLSPDVVRKVPRGEEFHITELFSHCLASGDPVGAYLVEEEWHDVGGHEELSHARGQI
ncbi:MAG: nucleotidyltransferase family protein [Gemmatimonadaceae bacterium]